MPINGLKKLKPAFWDHKDNAGTDIDFQRKWKLIVVFTSLMAIFPLIVMTYIDYRFTRRTLEEEVRTGMEKTLNCAVSSIAVSNETDKYAFEYIKMFGAKQDSDIFLVDRKGRILTPSYYYSDSEQQATYDINQLKGDRGLHETRSPEGETVITGYAKVPASSLTIVLVNSKTRFTKMWLKPRIKFIGFLAVSVVLIVLSIMGMATYLIDRIHKADMKRVATLHQAEYTNKFASIGRLASGVAHEINNPLAIISQKTGLILDMFTLTHEFDHNEKVIKLANDVMKAVDRCASITRRLLDFTRHMESRISPANIQQIIRQIFAFIEEEAQHRKITLVFDNPDPVKGFECDIGNLEQIFLNLFNNAFSAMQDGGELKIGVKLRKGKIVIIQVSDNGVGISPDHIRHIFEPFVAAEGEQWGTGLGLSITYGLVKAMGGDIMVKSKLGQGTCFTIILPLKAGQELNGDAGSFQQTQLLHHELVNTEYI